MLFNSLQFLIFFAVIFFLYYQVVPDKYRWLLLLVGSCYFYMAYVPKFILILFFLITLDFFLGIQIARSTGSQRKLFLILSICANVGTLLFFKYFNFFSANVAELAHLIHWNYSPLLLEMALPLGLSFHVFQSLSYVIEVYKGRQMPERRYGIYALYVMFFPQLVAGPIERPQHMLHQFHEPHSFEVSKVRRGLELMLWGFFKKMVIADRIAQIVNHVYANIDGSSGFTLFLAAILFAYQLYCDFSGYSDIAVGSALVFGYDLTRNFDRPYASRSIAEFWRRWHISLSSWLRDYLYYPLVFSGRKTKVWIYASLFITFTLIGLWHGANWTYVVFGALQAVYTIFSLLTVSARKSIRDFLRLSVHTGIEKAWQIFATFILFAASLIFFRAASVGEAIKVFEKIGSAFTHPFSLDLGVGTSVVCIILISIVLLEWVQYLQAQKKTLFILEDKKRSMRWSVYYVVIFSILLLGYLGAQPFVYFKF